MPYRMKETPATRESVAYDYSRLQKNAAAQQQTEQQDKQLEVRKGKSRAKVPYGKYTMIFAGVFMVLCVVIFNYMRVTELTSQNSQIKTTLAQLQSDENALNAKKEQIFNLAYVDDRAKNALGMVKADKSQVEYVDLSNDDAVVITNGKKSSSLITEVMSSLNAIVEYIKP